MLFKTFGGAAVCAATLANCTTVRTPTNQRDPVLFAELAASTYNNFEDMPAQIRADLLAQLYAELDEMDDSSQVATVLTNVGQDTCYPPHSDSDSSSCCDSNGPYECCLA